MGKTTLFRLLTGLVRPTSGQLTFDGASIGGARPYAIARRGLAQSFQRTAIFPRLTVLESVQAAVVARERRTGDMASWFHRACAPQADAILDRVGLGEFRDQAAGTLSHGDQRALDVALALAVRPRMLLLDEPTAGMSAAETAKTIDLIVELVRADGLTVLFSEHDMDLVFGISDTITVLHQGRVIADGPAEDVRADEEVMAVYLGAAQPKEAT